MNKGKTKLVSIEVELEAVGKLEIVEDGVEKRKAYIVNSIMDRLSIVLHEYADAIYEEVRREPTYLKPDEPGYVLPKVGHLPDYFTASNGIKMVLNMKTKPVEC